MTAADGVDGDGIDVGTALRQAERLLAEAEVPSPRPDAEELLAHVLGEPRGEVRRLAVIGERLSRSHADEFATLVAQRAQRVPLQHLTGWAHFRTLSLRVGPGVFIPRPETEVLVELALAHLRSLPTTRPRVIDLCTGSGAIALALAEEYPAAEVHAVELDEQAHAWAAGNIAALGSTVQLSHADAATAAADLLGAFDLVVSNPPYIPADMVPVDPEVHLHDPQIALYGGGVDGLEVPRAVAARAVELLRPGGVLLMEHGEDQGEAVATTLRHLHDWSRIDVHLDLSGRPRVTQAVHA